MTPCGRFATVAAWYFQQFERLLMVIADLRRFRGNILGFALTKGCKQAISASC
jgi:hypothetical protein